MEIEVDSKWKNKRSKKISKVIRIAAEGSSKPIVLKVVGALTVNKYTKDYLLSHYERVEG